MKPDPDDQAAFDGAVALVTGKPQPPLVVQMPRMSCGCPIDAHSDTVNAGMGPGTGKTCGRGWPIASTLATIHADNFEPVRTVAVTVLITSDASCEDIAKSFRRLLDAADVAGYQLGVAPVGSKLA